MEKRNFLKSMVLMGCFFSITSHFCFVFAAVDDYPKKPIKFAIYVEPGGGNDRSARILQPFLATELGVPVIVENRPGGSGEVCSTYLYLEEPDGYVMMSYNMPDYGVLHTMQNPIFRYEDIYPFLVTHVDQRIVLVRKDSPLNTLVDLIEEAKKNPGKISISTGSGVSPQTLQAIYLKRSLNLDYKVVPFKGGGPAGTALLGGHVDATWGDVWARYNLRDQTKCIGIVAKQPHPLWPEGKPINDQLMKYGVTIPELPRNQILCVRSDFKKKYPERYKKLQSAILKASQNKEYIEMEKKQKLDYMRMWQPGENFEEDFKNQFEFIKKHKTLFQEQ